MATKRKPKPEFAYLPTATKSAVKLGMVIVHDITGQQQTLNEFGLNFWKNCHPIERKGWHILKP
jgi:hypothetical protein